MGYKNENFNSVVALSARTCSENHVCYCRDCTQGGGGGGGGGVLSPCACKLWTVKYFLINNGSSLQFLFCDS